MRSPAKAFSTARSWSSTRGAGRTSSACWCGSRLASRESNPGRTPWSISPSISFTATVESLLDRPLAERRRLLSELLAHPPSPIVESSYAIGRGTALFEEARERGLEGIFAKKLDSRYLPGERTRDWLKVKVRREVDAVLVGLVRERGGEANQIAGARLCLETGRLVWIGNAGSGIDQTTLKDLETALDGLRSPPPPEFEAEAPGEIEWLAPRLVVRVQYTGLTKEKQAAAPGIRGVRRQSGSQLSIPGSRCARDETWRRPD